MIADTDSARARISTALVAAIDRVGQGKPTVLVIEDFHSASAGTLAWLSFARRRSRRTLFVATTRTGGAPSLEAAKRLGLGPLGRNAVADLVGPDRADALYERSGGHPLLLAALADSPDESLPATVRDAVAARVDSLGEDVGATLRVAAVLGPTCDLELVAQVGARPVVDVLAHLEAAAPAGLVVERGSRFEFRHQMIRQALEAATGAARRAFLHQQVHLSPRPVARKL